MKPVRLALQAFGPFLERQELNFTAFEKTHFFLIHGSTGSGKTMLLDAMTFALYGKSSGDRRQPATLRSQHALAEDATEVSFEFRLNQQVLRVERKMSMPRAGAKNQTPRLEATLWKAAAESELGWEVMETGASKVSQKVECLLGLSADQFRQVVVIPQGRFREVLEAKSDQREIILKTLFQTELYQRISEESERRAKIIRDQLTELKQGLVKRLETAKVEDYEGLQEQLKAEETTLQSLDQQMAGAKSQLDAAQETLEKAQAIEKCFLEEEQAAVAQGDWVKLDQELKAVRLSFENGRRAAQLSDAFEALQKSASFRQAQQSALKLLREAQPKLQAVYDQSVAEQALNPTRASRIRELEKEMHQLETYGVQVPKLVHSRTQKLELERKIKSAQVACDAAAKAFSTQQALLDDLRELRQQVLHSATEKVELRVRLQKTETRLEAVKRRRSHQEKILSLEKEQTEGRKKLEEIKTALAKAEKSLEHLQAAWEATSAARLAQRLEAQAPCPVCGSLEHPQPATAGDRTPPQESEMEEARQDVQSARHRLDQQSAVVQRGALQLAGVKQGLAELAEESSDEATLALQLENTQKQLEAIMEKAQQASKQKLEEVQAVVKNAAQTWEAQKTILAELEKGSVAAASVESQIASEVPDALQNVGALEQSARAVREEKTRLSEQNEKADAQLKSSGDVLAAWKLDFTRQDAESKSAEADWQGKDREWQALLGKHKFATTEDWQAAVLSKEALGTMEKRIEEHDRQRFATEERLQRARAALSGLQRPDLPELLAKRQERHQAVHELLKQQGELDARRKQLLALAALIEDDLKKQAAAEEAYGKAQRVAEVLSGKSGAKLSFHRFVLTAFLDDTLFAATGQLHRMSRGRYRLERRRDALDGRVASGLDLDVFDNLTGMRRPVDTLSGGEAFLATLSLALGLADVVRSYSGGVQLDALFIDEGFGSLDPEALDEAIKTLMDLRQGGRLVGIISHVPELRERVDARLEVNPSARGSKLAIRQA
ncbi:MAG: AAA family ATPase [Verrucomicrobiales bacterium]